MIEYVAGVIDARGHIESVTRHGVPTARVRVTTRRRDLLNYVQKLAGGGVRIDERGYQRRPCSDHCNEQHTHVARQSAYWDVTGERAVIILFNVLPFLVDHRAEAYAALENGAAAWPVKPRRTEVSVEMRRRGWAIPVLADLPVRATQTKCGILDRSGHTETGDRS